ncbi:PadR family transcriptional regulator [Vibrio fluvialis]|uniref:PadR family transcriptional regulator n=1 Tax=Vibrio fluvialis TaxID=676 RepID=UPI001EEC0063|nr:PadR family transcriptional regulator [Vibrio fluvialis]MCG6387517.1 PadR family transcriptional regulator [Vibrio fluvialis]MCG6418887.1 PadR family transcriptional regulator [Vibrio fluvialis]
MKNVKLSSLPEILLAEIAHSKVGVSGYHLTKVMGPIWAASHQQVYRELNIMKAEGYLSCQGVPQAGKPDLKLYTATAEGQALLESLSRRTYDNARSMLFRSDSVSKLAIGNWSFYESLISDLETKIVEADKQLNDHDSVYVTPYAKLVLERERGHWAAELDFARKALAYVVSA